MDYYHGNNQYYDGISSPQQHYYPYKANYRHPQQGRYSRSRRNSNRVHSMGDPSYYYNEEVTTSPYSYYDRPLNRRSMYYNNEDDSSYCTASEYQQPYDEGVYGSPIKNNRRESTNKAQVDRFILKKEKNSQLM